MTSIHQASPSYDAAGTTGGVSVRPCIVVTGASEGIGLALAHRFAEGLKLPVIMIARRADRLADAARDVAARQRVATYPIPLDLTAPDAAHRIDAALTEASLYPEVFINNAGIGLGGSFAEHEEADIARLVDLNVKALALLTRHVLPGMLERGRGTIINIASLGGYAPGPYQAAYYASKAFVVSLTRALAFETAGTSIRVVAVAPGPVDTRFHERMGADASFYRVLMPALSAEGVAMATWRGWRWGFRVIHPGFFTPGIALSMRILPWMLLVPLVGWLLHKRLKK